MRKFCGKNEREIINYEIIELELIMLSSQSIYEFHNFFAQLIVEAQHNCGFCEVSCSFPIFSHNSFQLKNIDSAKKSAKYERTKFSFAGNPRLHLYNQKSNNQHKIITIKSSNRSELFSLKNKIRKLQNKYTPSLPSF